MKRSRRGASKCSWIIARINTNLVGFTPRDQDPAGRPSGAKKMTIPETVGEGEKEHRQMLVSSLIITRRRSIYNSGQGGRACAPRENRSCCSRRTERGLRARRHRAGSELREAENAFLASAESLAPQRSARYMPRAIRGLRGPPAKSCSFSFPAALALRLCAASDIDAPWHNRARAISAV